MRTARCLVALLMLGGAASCAELGPLSADTCGNGVLEDGEDCDGAPLEPALGRHCGAADSENRAEACRMLCSVTEADGLVTEYRCPDGWSCGPDGICREWIGEFNAALSFDADVQQIAAADFDGDQRDEILAIGSSEITVHYIEDGARVLTTGVGSADQSPAVGDLQADVPEDAADPPTKAADLVLTQGLGVRSLLGHEDRKLNPVVYPWVTQTIEPGEEGQLVALELDDQHAGDEVVYVTADKVVRENGSLVYPAPPGRRIDLGHPIAAGWLGIGACERLVLPMAPSDPKLGPDELVLVNGCTGAGQSLALMAATIPEAVIASPVRILDVNQDGVLDVAAAIAHPGASNKSTRFDLMYAQGPFNPTPERYCSQGYFTTAVASSLCTETVRPLALGDLDGDQVLDAIEPCGIHLSGLPAPPDSASCSVTSGVLFSISLLNPGAPWSTALIAELTSDGRADAVAASSESAGLNFFRGTGGQALDYAEIPTLRSIKEIAVGDFDGDQTQDIVLREGAEDAAGAPVSVAFGRAMSVPEAPVELSRVPDAAQFCVGDLASNALFADAMNDFAVLQRGAGALQFEVALFTGDASRQLQSAFRFAEDGQDEGQVRVPRRVALGRFRKVDGAYPLGIGALVFAPPEQGDGGPMGGSAEIWFARIKAADGSLDDKGSLPGNPTPLWRGGQSGLPPGLQRDTQMAALHLGDGLGDALVVAAVDPQKHPQLLVMPPCADDPCPVVPKPIWLEEESEAGEVEVRIDQLGIAEGGSGDIAVLITNADAVSVDPTSNDTLFDRPSSRIVLVQDESLDSLGTHKISVGVSALQEGGASDGDAKPDSQTITAFAWLDVDGDERDELLVLTRDALHCARRMPDFTVQPCGGALSLPQGGGRALAVGDVNGDGLKDLVIGDEGQFRLYLARARNQ